MAMAGGRDDGQPMMEMNTTPLIDVLLVLLILIIITIPMQNHSVDIDLPSPSNAPANNINPIKNKIVLSPTDEILWNGEAINQNQLVTNLQATKALPVEPELQFEPDAEAGNGRAARRDSVIKASGVNKFGFVG